MKVCIVGLLLFFGLAHAAGAQQTLPNLPRVGAVVDAQESRYFGLFRGRDIDSARVTAASPDSITFSLWLRIGSADQVVVSRQQFDDAAAFVNRYEESVREGRSAWVKLRPMFSPSRPILRGKQLRVTLEDFTQMDGVLIYADAAGIVLAELEDPVSIVREPERLEYLLYSNLRLVTGGRFPSRFELDPTRMNPEDLRDALSIHATIGSVAGPEMAQQLASRKDWKRAIDPEDQVGPQRALYVKRPDRRPTLSLAPGYALPLAGMGSFVTFDENTIELNHVGGAFPVINMYAGLVLNERFDIGTRVRYIPPPTWGLTGMRSDAARPGVTVSGVYVNPSISMIVAPPMRERWTSPVAARFGIGPLFAHITTHLQALSRYQNTRQTFGAAGMFEGSYAFNRNLAAVASLYMNWLPGADEKLTSLDDPTGFEDQFVTYARPNDFFATFELALRISL